MSGSIRVARILGIPINVHVSWLLVFFFMTWMFADGVLPSVPGVHSPAAQWLVAAATSLLLFGCVLAHEIAHCLLARRGGLPIAGVTLFLHGGVADFPADPESPGVELAVALAGPVMSLLLALGFGALHWLLDAASLAPALSLIAGVLGLVNGLLVVFNLLPGYPLDGGRVLHALLWRRFDDRLRAMAVAARTGYVSAAVFALLGLAQLAQFPGALGSARGLLVVVYAAWLFAITVFFARAAGQAGYYVQYMRAHQPAPVAEPALLASPEPPTPLVLDLSLLHGGSVEKF